MRVETKTKEPELDQLHKQTKDTSLFVFPDKKKKKKIRKMRQFRIEVDETLTFVANLS